MKLHELVPAQVKANTYNVIIEISAGEQKVKYEYDPELGCITVDRFVQTAFHYPCNYGFIPQTLALDGDPVDALVLSNAPLMPGSVIEVRVVGMLMMEDEKGRDEKILCLPTEKADPSLAYIQEYTDLSPQLLNQLKHFFERYKDLDQGKWVKVTGYENKKAAEQSILDGIKAVKK